MQEKPNVPVGRSNGRPAQNSGKMRLEGSKHVAPQKAAPGIVPALENAIAIIQAVNAAGQDGVSLAEVTTKLGISKSHCHSLLKTLVYFDWLQFDQKTRVYRVFSGILSSISSLFNQDFTQTVQERIAQFAAHYNIPCILTQLQSDGTFVIVNKFHGTQSAEISLPIGFRYPRDAPAQSRAYLAWSSPEQVDAWLGALQVSRYTQATLLDVSQIRAELAATRARGYARSNGELTEGLMAISVPIFDRTGRLVFVFSCIDLTQAALPRERAIGSAMKKLAEELQVSTV